MALKQQQTLFELDETASEPETESEMRASSTFTSNMRLPVHRWFRYSAGFSADWVESVISSAQAENPAVRVFDPFAGSATTLIAAEQLGVESAGIDAHPFVSRIAAAKLEWRSDPDAYVRLAREVARRASTLTPQLDSYPPLVRACYDDDTLGELDALRRATNELADGSPAAALVWLTFLCILRRVSKAGTAQWQYILPKKQKRAPARVGTAFADAIAMVETDMRLGREVAGPRSRFSLGDARTCEPIETGFANLVITSPPYPNNYDYADATRLEMSVLGEVAGWGDLQERVRQYLVRSCTQHVPERSNDLAAILSAPELLPIAPELSRVCADLAEIRQTKGGKKTYHLMIACYFLDLAQTWMALRRVCASPSRVCFVIGDSAPYGVYVPVVPWLGTLALAAGFKSYTFEKTRDRNIKWKNRKHRVPLQEGRLWVEG